MRKSRLHWRSVLKGLIELEETPYSLQISKEVEFVNEPLNEYYSQEINPDFKELEAMDVATHGWDLKFESPVGEDWVLDGYMKLDTNYTFLIMSQGHG